VLTLWSEGIAPTPAKLEGFLEKPWASRVAAYLIPIKTLAQSESWWSQVFELAMRMIDLNSIDDILNDGPDADDPRTVITISDDE
jgi:hypothetical protein